MRTPDLSTLLHMMATGWFKYEFTGDGTSKVTALEGINPDMVYAAATNSVQVLGAGVGAISRALALLATNDELEIGIRDDLSVIFSTLAELSDAVSVMNDLVEVASDARKGSG
jgi:hypothetical protein